MFATSKPVQASASLRVLAALLSYPDERVRAHLGELPEILHREAALGAGHLHELDALIEALATADPFDAQAAYVELFDRGRATSLHLFEHVHGDSRDRGPAMVDLMQTYEQAGLLLAPGELPDYLPVMLEFASTQPPREARALLGEIAHILAALSSALRARGSAYASVLGALLELAGEPVRACEPAAEPPLDETWAEPPVFAGCSREGQSGPGQFSPGQSSPRPSRTVHIVHWNDRTGAS